jgi:hypothetical protein
VYFDTTLLAEGLSPYQYWKRPAPAAEAAKAAPARK